MTYFFLQVKFGLLDVNHGVGSTEESMPKRGKYFIGEFLHWPSCGEERLAENGNPICMYVQKGRQKLVSKATNPKSFVQKCVYIEKEEMHTRRSL